MNEIKNERIIKKADFYEKNNLKAHILVVPKPKFKNGTFVSGLQGLKDQEFFWFLELNSSIPIRLFLNEIDDIEDYKEREVSGR